VAGSFVGNAPADLLPVRFRREGAEWARSTRFAAIISVVAGAGLIAIVALGR
jgi:hypothetical protein